MAANSSDTNLYRRGVFRTGEITATCALPSDEAIAGQEAAARLAAADGSGRLLRAMLFHGVRHGGVLSLTAEACHARLDALTAVKLEPSAGVRRIHEGA